MTKIESLKKEIDKTPLDYEKIMKILEQIKAEEVENNPQLLLKRIEELEKRVSELEKDEDSEKTPFVEKDSPYISPKIYTMGEGHIEQHTFPNPSDI